MLTFRTHDKLIGDEIRRGVFLTNDGDVIGRIFDDLIDDDVTDDVSLADVELTLASRALSLLLFV